MESCVEAPLSVVQGEGVPRVVDKVHADGGAELGVLVQATIWGIVLPATARLPLGGLPASLNTAVNALRHVGARGCRRDVQGQEVGAPELAGGISWPQRWLWLGHCTFNMAGCARIRGK